MSEEIVPKCAEPSKSRRILLLLAGIVLGQFILYGPSLVGKKVLLPLDVLAGKGFYLPQTPEVRRIAVKDGSVADRVTLFEPARRFAVSEFKAGRLPLWTPYQYAGAPFNLPLCSPYTALQCSSESPLVLAWSQLLLALISGVGAYVFFRSVLGVSFWPAAVGAWCYPLTGFFVLWQGFPLTQPVSWFPWLLLLVDKTVRGTWRYAPLGLAVVTCFCLNGQLDVAGQVLLMSGLYALWCLVDNCRNAPAGATHAPSTTERRGIWASAFIPKLASVRGPFARLVAGWGLGFLLAAPYILPVLAYSQTGARMMRRAAGNEERPPVGLSALPQLVLPDIYGTWQPPSFRFAGGTPQQETSAAGYAGLFATLLLAPLAFCSARHRRTAALWVGLSVFALSWCLDIPGFVALLRLPILKMMSHDRLVFACCFTLLALAVTGLDFLVHAPLRWRAWMWLPVLVLGAFCLWCTLRSIYPPTPVATLAQRVSSGSVPRWIRNLDEVRRTQDWFRRDYSSAAILSGLGVMAWILLRSGRVPYRTLLTVICALQLGELLWFGYGRNVQCDPALYYPPIPVLKALAKEPPGRIIGFDCLPATLSTMFGLRDVRGYDGVDPARLVPLVLSAADPLSPKPPYAPTMIMVPRATITPSGDIQLPPVLDLLGVRYVIFRGSPFPKAHPILEGLDYWVLQNPRALPRAFVPHHVEIETNEGRRLRRLESPDFAPRSVAYVESAVRLPASCHGTVEITREVPSHISLTAQMQTPGLVVLSDLWDKGWRTYLDGKRVPLLRTDHTIRGVVVPVGTHQIEFNYEPVSWARGLWLAALSLLVLLGWVGVILWKPRLS